VEREQSNSGSKSIRLEREREKRGEREEGKPPGGEVGEGGGESRAVSVVGGDDQLACSPEGGVHAGIPLRGASESEDVDKESHCCEDDGDAVPCEQASLASLLAAQRLRDRSQLLRPLRLSARAPSCPPRLSAPRSAPPLPSAPSQRLAEGVCPHGAQSHMRFPPIPCSIVLLFSLSLNRAHFHCHLKEGICTVALLDTERSEALLIRYRT